MSTRRFNLSECPDGGFCFSCGTGYVDARTVCDECGAPVTSVAAIRTELHASLRRGATEVREVEVLSELLATDDDADLAEVRSALSDGGLPFLVVEETGAPGEPPLLRVFVDERDEERLHENLEAGAGRGQELVPLTSAADAVAAMDVRRRLDEAGVRFAESQFAPQYGLVVGELGEVQFQVLAEDLERAQAALAAEAPPLDEPEP